MYQKFEQMRQERGLSVYAVAKHCGIPQSTLYAWRERCKSGKHASLSAAYVVQIARCLGVDVAWLVGE